MWVFEGHRALRAHIMPDHGGDRGAVLLVLAPHDHLHINQIRTPRCCWSCSGDQRPNSVSCMCRGVMWPAPQPAPFPQVTAKCADLSGGSGRCGSGPSADVAAATARARARAEFFADHRTSIVTCSVIRDGLVQSGQRRQRQPAAKGRLRAVGYASEMAGLVGMRDSGGYDTYG